MTLRGAFSAKSAHLVGRLRKLWISAASLLASLEARRSWSMTQGDSTLSIRENYPESVSDGVKTGVLHIGNARRYRYCGAYATHHTLELTSPGKFLSMLIQPSARAILALGATIADRCSQTRWPNGQRRFHSFTSERSSPITGSVFGSFTSGIVYRAFA